MQHSEHAPAERASWEEIHAQMTALQSNTALQGSVKASQEPVLLLNTHRQIVYANVACQKMLCGDEDPDMLYACRPGESMHCIRADLGAGGCGTCMHCRVCSAVNTILKSLHGNVEVQRCSIQRAEPQTPLDFILFSMPVHIQNETYVLLVIQNSDDINDSNHTLAQQVFELQRLARIVEKG